MTLSTPPARNSSRGRSSIASSRSTAPVTVRAHRDTLAAACPRTCDPVALRQRDVRQVWAACSLAKQVGAMQQLRVAQSACSSATITVTLRVAHAAEKGGLSTLAPWQPFEPRPPQRSPALWLEREGRKGHSVVHRARRVTKDARRRTSSSQSGVERHGRPISERKYEIDVRENVAMQNRFQQLQGGALAPYTLRPWIRSNSVHVI